MRDLVVESTRLASGSNSFTLAESGIYWTERSLNRSCGDPHNARQKETSDTEDHDALTVSHPLAGKYGLDVDPGKPRPDYVMVFGLNLIRQGQPG